MGRLVRCIEGHIFEVDKGPTCPVCGAATTVSAEDMAAAAQASAAPAGDAPAPATAQANAAAAIAEAKKVAAGAAASGAKFAAGASASAVKFARGRNGAYAAGAAAVVLVAAIAYVFWPASAPLLPLPPAFETLAQLDASDQEALNHRLDQFLPGVPAGQAVTIHFPNDRDGQAMTALGLSPDLIVALDAVNGWYLAVTGDPKDGLAVLVSAARRGSVTAMEVLGDYLSRAPQQPTDVRIGFDALVLSGNAGMRAGHFVAADLLRQGRLRELPNPEKVITREMTLAAELGHPDAIKFLTNNGWPPPDEDAAIANASRRDNAAGLAKLVAAARRGWPQAAFELGNEMLDESHAPKGLRADRTVALRWLRFAGDRNEIEALRELGLCYLQGTGVAANKPEAFLWNYLALIKSEWVAPPPPESEKAAIKAVLIDLLDGLSPAQKDFIRRLQPPGNHPGSFLAPMLGAAVASIKPEVARQDVARQNMAKAYVPPAASAGKSLPDSDLRVSIGQTSDEVKAAYGLTDAPSVFNNTKTMLKAPQLGMMFFFGENGRLETIRAEQPFNGKIVGIAIGDRLNKVRAAFGEPVQNFPFGGQTANVYSMTGWPANVRFDTTADGTIAIIFVNHK